MSNLRRCPFCGGKGELWNNKLTYRLYGVICEECDCMTPYFTTREEAIEAWNRREPIDRIKELEEEIEELKTLTGLQRKRTYYNRFVKEVFQKEKGSDLIYPDFDEIYKRYFELLHQREKIVEKLEEKLKEPRYQHDGEDYFVGIIEAIEIVKGGAV